MQDRLLAALVPVAGDVHEAHPGVPAQPLHACAELQLVEALRDVGLALCLQPAQPAACLRNRLVLRGDGVLVYHFAEAHYDVDLGVGLKPAQPADWSGMYGVSLSHS